MATGYTIYIENGEITNGKDFLLLCAQKDGSITRPISKYKKNNYENAKRSLEEVVEISLDEAKKRMKIEYDNNIYHAMNNLEKLKAKSACYKKIRNEIKRWIPPNEECFSIKKFALEQINISDSFSEGIERYQQIINTPFDDSDEAAIKYIQKLINVRKNNMERAKKQYEDEIRRIERRKQFVNDFVESLKQIEEENK